MTTKSKRQIRPFAARIALTDKADLERFAKADGIQRGFFVDSSGKLRAERVSATAQFTWLFKTKAGKPYKW